MTLRGVAGGSINLINGRRISVIKRLQAGAVRAMRSGLCLSFTMIQHIIGNTQDMLAF